ncbi:hypothetical protein VTK56DRAFT_2373 [Thermocarpiscus australiensis]
MRRLSLLSDSSHPHGLSSPTSCLLPMSRSRRQTFVLTGSAGSRRKSLASPGQRSGATRLLSSTVSFSRVGASTLRCGNKKIPLLLVNGTLNTAGRGEQVCPTVFPSHNASMTCARFHRPESCSTRLWLMCARPSRAPNLGSPGMASSR